MASPQAGAVWTDEDQLHALGVLLRSEVQDRLADAVVPVSCYEHDRQIDITQCSISGVGHLGWTESSTSIDS